MKKFLTIFLSLILLVALPGCAEKTTAGLSAEETKASDFVENSAESSTEGFAETENLTEDLEGSSEEDSTKKFTEN